MLQRPRLHKLVRISKFKPSTLPLSTYLFAMDTFFTIASPIASEQPEIPYEEESGSGRGTSTSCTIA